MKLKSFFLLAVLFNSTNTWGYGSGSGTCDVVADFSSITAMPDRTRNLNTGGYVLSANTASYNSFEHLEITLTATGTGNQAQYTGIVISVVDDQGTKVGTFNFDDETAVRDCGGSAMMAATHTISHGSVNSRTLFWVPPSETVGNIHVLAYVLSGVRGESDTQEFYRLVRGDGALTLEPNADLIFFNGFES